MVSRQTPQGSLFRVLDRSLIRGPDPLPSGMDQASPWDTLLTWPARLTFVFGTFVIGWIWNDAPVGVQLGWGLQYGLLAAISVVTSLWWWLLLVNTALALAWLVLSRKPPEAGKNHQWLHIVTWLNRQAGHLEALCTWAALSLIVCHQLMWQLPAFFAVLLLGEPIINGVARSRWFGGEQANQSRETLHMVRRSIIYFATLLGIFLLALQAPKQFATILPLMLTLLPAGALRYLRLRLRRKQEADDPDLAQRRQTIAKQHARWADALVGPGLVLVLFLILSGVSIWRRSALASQAQAERDKASLQDVCETGGPKSPSIAVMLIADTQLHELGGAPFSGQIEAIDAVVPVALRPVELDMLSTAAVLHFADQYRDLKVARAKAGLPAPMWAHLGDFADLSCVSEMERMLQLLDGFGEQKGLLAGLAPGNHDSAFFGNFDWSPFWDTACRKPVAGASSTRLDKSALDSMLEKALVEGLPKQAVTLGVSGLDPASALTSGRTPTARITLTPLGTLQHGGEQGTRGVLGIFVDTADRMASNWGIAGEFGTFSDAQRERIVEQVEAVRAGGGAWQHPWLVVFSHHPYASLTRSSKKEFDALLAALDTMRQGPSSPPPLLALISAHTHKGAAHVHCIGQRKIREIVVGSVIDPPQQAALLEIGLNDDARASLRVTALPALAAAEERCPGDPAGLAGTASCERVISNLAVEAECQDLLGSGTSEEPVACETLERQLTLKERLAGLVRYGGSASPDELRVAQTRRARALMRCLCRESAATLSCPLDDPLAGDAFAPVIAQLARDPQRQSELTCLSVAAAAVQTHKAAGMTMADALRCSFDDPGSSTRSVRVAIGEELACH